MADRQIPKLTEQKFVRILTDELGLTRGSVVFIHSSVDGLNLDFPFSRIIPIIREIIGENGTALFPTTQFLERAEEYIRKGEIFDVRRSPSKMGLISEDARRQKDAFRSRHPTNSVAAIGRLARELTENHIRSIYPCGEDSPYHMIIKHGGIIVGLGVSTVNLSFVHCVEDDIKDRFPVETRTQTVFECPVRDYEGREFKVRTLVAHRRIRMRNIERYVRRYIPGDVCRDMNINGIRFFRADAAKLFKTMEELALKGITIYSRFVYRKSPFSRFIR